MRCAAIGAVELGRRPSSPSGVPRWKRAPPFTATQCSVGPARTSQVLLAPSRSCCALPWGDPPGTFLSRLLFSRAPDRGGVTCERKQRTPAIIRRDDRGPQREPLRASPPAPQQHGHLESPFQTTRSTATSRLPPAVRPDLGIRHAKRLGATASLPPARLRRSYASDETSPSAPPSTPATWLTRHRPLNRIYFRQSGACLPG
jgi:hypothetical protein